MENKVNLTELIVFFLQNVENDPYVHLAKICRPVAIYAIERRYLRGYEREDFWQVAYEVLWKSVETYSFEKEMKFLSYYSLMLENHLNRLVRADNAQKRQATKHASSLTALEEKIGSLEDAQSTIAINPDKAVVVEEAMAHYLQDLSPFELDVFFRYISNQSYDDIASELKCPRKKVQSAIHRCKRKLKEHLK